MKVSDETLQDTILPKNAMHRDAAPARGNVLESSSRLAGPTRSHPFDKEGLGGICELAQPIEIPPVPPFKKGGTGCGHWPVCGSTFRIVAGVACIVSVLLAAVCGLWAAQADECLVHLEGEQRFRAGDEPSWALADEDDSRWSSLLVPSSWECQGVKPENGVGWYRIRFGAPEENGRARYAVALGRIGSAEEVFLNGVKVGSEGLCDGHPVGIPWKERYYEVPENLLVYGGPNLLAIRVMSDSRAGGVLQGPACLGYAADLLVGKQRRELTRMAVEISLFTFLLLFFVVTSFLYVAGMRESEYVSFGVFVFLYATLRILDSLTFYETGMKTLMVHNAIVSLALLLPAAGLVFLLCVYREPIRGVNVITVAVCGLLIAGAVLAFFSVPCRLLLRLDVFPLMIPAGLALFLALRAYRKGYYESRPALVAVAGGVAGVFVEAAGAWSHRYYPGLSPTDYGVLFFMVSIAYALMARYGRIRKTMQMLSGRILEAHEEERKRLSREIHDGVGQWLPALKLRLQMMESAARTGTVVKPDQLEGLISEASHTITELRHMALDLRPSFLENISLFKVLEWYCKDFSSRTGITVQVEGDETLDAPSRIKDNLYRICQEALSNVRKHAEADGVVVRAAAKGKRISLAIVDNGSGFDPGRVSGRSGSERFKGLGLSTMRERAELLGGTFRLDTAPGKGVSIDVEVPIP